MLQDFSRMEFHPVLAEEDISLAQYTKIPLSRLPALGIAFEPVVAAVQSAVAGTSTTALYKVTIPSGMHLASFKNGAGNLGTYLDANNSIAGQAILNPLVFNPTTLFMAAALASIDKKLDTIQELQHEILNYLEQKDKAELKGNLTFLADILNNYKFNWNNELYRNSNHTKVLDIKQSGEQQIIFYRQQIIDKVHKQTLLHMDLDVKNRIEQVTDTFKDYRLALYTFSFASFLDIMLLGNYQEEFLGSVTGKIRDYSEEYQVLYNQVHDQMENYSRTSVQAAVLKGLSIATAATGEQLAKTSLLKNSKVSIDEALLGAGSKLRELGQNRSDKVLAELTEAKENCTAPFIESIETVGEWHNHPVTMLFDHETIYLGVA